MDGQGSGGERRDGKNAERGNRGCELRSRPRVIVYHHGMDDEPERSGVSPGILRPECLRPCRRLHDPFRRLPAEAAVGRNPHPSGKHAFPRRTGISGSGA